MKNLFITATAAVLLFSSCSDKAEMHETKADSSSAVKLNEPEEADEHQHDDHGSEAIELNDGKKWTVNAEMKPFIANSEKLVTDYKQSGSADYRKLAEQLSAENDKLIKSCTMEGKSHDELHKWLHPHLELVKQLKEVSEQRHADAVVSNLETSFKDFHTYFE